MAKMMTDTQKAAIINTHRPFSINIINELTQKILGTFLKLLVTKVCKKNITCQSNLQTI
jgi:hypothetical protein